MIFKDIFFSKYSGAGNDFILIDDLTTGFPVNQQQLIKSLCHRHFGIGGDGVILLQPSTRCDFRMRIFNSDGSEAEMCGNGIRCLAQFIKDRGYSCDHAVIETMHRLIGIQYLNEDICVEMGLPEEICWDLSLPIQKNLNLHFLNTGVPHAVVFVDHLPSCDVLGMGRAIRHHIHFQPYGTNVNFAFIDANGEVWNRTYERGVENETQACGTGATAVALAASQVYSLPSPIRVHTLSGDILSISFAREGSDFKDVKMAGSARKIFSGTAMALDLIERC